MADHTKVTVLANHFADLLEAVPDHPSIVDCLDYVTGAVFALLSMSQHKYWDRHGSFLTDYKRRLVGHLRNMAAGAPLNEYWIGGFYFYSAAQRVAAAYDRLPRLLLKVPGTDHTSPHELFKRIYGKDDRFPAWKQIYCEFNPLKHWPEGMSAGKKFSPDDAIKALEEIVEFLQEKQSELRAAYS